MGLIIILLLGAFIGWVASIVTNREGQQGAIGNIVVGVLGAFVGGLISHLATGSDRSALAFDLSSLLWALLGAVLLCVALNYAQRGSWK